MDYTSIGRKDADPHLTASSERKSIADRIQRRAPYTRFTLRAFTTTRMQSYLILSGLVLGGGVVLGPWLWDAQKEAGGYRIPSVDSSHMPRMSPQWWENEWRKMNPLWRVGESTDDFFVGPYAFVKSQTGRDLSSAASFIASSPTAPSSYTPRQSRLGLLLPSWPRGEQGDVTTVPRVLVPLCGDSPIVHTMAGHGFEVDAVDVSETAMRAAVSRVEQRIPPEMYNRVHLHWSNFFAPELWNGALKDKRYDVIYERRGLPAVDRSQREDYAFLLKRALKEDGVMYVEGIYRTGRVKGNKLHGPPYSLSRRELQHLFPESEGFFVRCEEKTDAMLQLSRESRVLQRIPRSLYVTPFHCAVFREAAVNLATRNVPLDCTSSLTGTGNADKPKQHTASE